MELNAEYISAGAFVVSCISALIAFISLRNSSRALVIAEKDFAERSKSISLYLAEARKIRIRDGEVFAAFNISITNCSTLPNTLPRIELSVRYSTENGLCGETLIGAEEASPKEITGIEFSAAPLNTSAKSTVSVWLLFRLGEALRNREIQMYKVSAETSDGTVASVETHILFDTVIYDKRDK